MSEKYVFRFVFTGSNDCINEAYYQITVPEGINEPTVRQVITNVHDRLHREAKNAMDLYMKMEEDLTEQEKAELEEADANNPYFGVPETADSLLKYLCKKREGWSYKRVRNYFHMPSGEWGLGVERQQEQDINPLSVERLGRF